MSKEETMRPTFDSMGFTPEEAMDSLSEDVEIADAENNRLRARIAELERELARYDCSAADARICKQQMIEQRARAEKAEADAEARFVAILADATVRVLDAQRAQKKAEADLLAIANATGIVYEPDTGPCWPGPTDEIVKAIKGAAHGAREAYSLRARIAEQAREVTSLQCDLTDRDACIEAMKEYLGEAIADRDRYLAAIREWVAADDEWIGSVETVDRLETAESALRRIAEEKP